jgi:uncharacterized membrane protein YjgN (DUF898 family)
MGIDNDLHGDLRSPNARNGSRPDLDRWANAPDLSLVAEPLARSEPQLRTDAANHANAINDAHNAPRHAGEGRESNPELNLMTLAPSARAGEKVEAFKFTGKAGEYFRIWIVNTFLVIITLGLWSPWAKIRKRKFFLRHTWVAGANFEYHANPWAILRGRLIAGVAFLVYWFTGEINPNYAPWVAFVLALLAPWLVVSSLRFNLANSSYRNIRFGFDGTVLDGIKALWPLWVVTLSAVINPPAFDFNQPGYAARNSLALLTYLVFVFAYPYLHGAMRLLVLNHSRYGHAPIDCTTRIKTFYTIYLRGALVGIGVMVIAGIITGILSAFVFGAFATNHLGLGKVLFVALVVVSSLPVAAAALIWYAFTQTRLINATFNLTTISTNVRLFSRIQTSDMVKLYLFNTVVVLFTLGLAIPFAAVRTAKQRVETTALAIGGDLNDIIADVVPAASASAEAATEFFSLDVAL